MTAKEFLVLFLVLVAIATFVFFVLFEDRRKAKQKMERETFFWVEANKLISAHIQTLTLKQKQMMTQDAYGNYQADRWLQEINYFIENVVAKGSNLATYFPITPKKHLDLTHALINLVCEYEKKQIETNASVTIDVDSLDAIQFEHYCSDLLGRSGWISRVTQASGDQGIDIIANYGNVKAVFQCKKYSQPVGNSAVQEIIAGKAFEQAHVAAVVTNSTFTPAAKQLAGSTGVHLLHFSELPIFSSKLGLVEA